MTPAARIQTAIEILDTILGGQPAEQALTAWARRSRFAGSKDRAAIRDHVFDVLRRQSTFDALGGGATGRHLMIGSCRANGVSLEEAFSGGTYGPDPLELSEHEAGTEASDAKDRLDIPNWLWPTFQADLGQKADDVAAALQNRAPVQLRVNVAKSDRETVQQKLQDEGIETVVHATVGTALNVLEGARKINNSACFQEGLIELQDASSQAVVEALSLTPGMRVLDYCAGGGGKALALAAHDGVTVVAHDIAPQRMKDIPKRAARAGVDIQCVSTAELDELTPFDIVLVDAPCSGSGAWRRAPAGKWELSQARLDELVAIQSQVLSQCSELTSPKGVLAYATCSLLVVENKQQVDIFVTNHPTWSCVFSKAWTPLEDGDGFYTAHLTR
jgi:16S rRNA (cytosine967-C5)-methyltransferase